MQLCDACGGGVLAIWYAEFPNETGLNFCNHHCVKYEEKLVADGVVIYPIQPALIEEKNVDNR